MTVGAGRRRAGTELQPGRSSGPPASAVPGCALLRLAGSLIYGAGGGRCAGFAVSCRIKCASPGASPRASCHSVPGSLAVASSPDAYSSIAVRVGVESTVPSLCPPAWFCVGLNSDHLEQVPPDLEGWVSGKVSPQHSSLVRPGHWHPRAHPLPMPGAPSLPQSWPGAPWGRSWMRAWSRGRVAGRSSAFFFTVAPPPTPTHRTLLHFLPHCPSVRF